MDGRLFKIVMLVLFLLLNGCGGEPSRPESLNEIPEELVYNPPELFPLAAGASWVYSVSLINSFNASSVGPCGNNKEFGQLEITVTEEKIINDYRVFVLNCELKIDSSLHRYSSICNDPHRQDTIWTIYGVLDTTITRVVTLANDTLWLNNGDNLEYIMPGVFSDGILINLNFFGMGRYDDLAMPLSLADHIARVNRYHFAGYGVPQLGGAKSVDSYFYPDSGGPVHLKAHSDRGSISYDLRSLEFLLLEYSPGNQVARNPV